MKNKFGNVPVEADTIIEFRVPAKLGKYDVLYEKWCWDGVSAESLIFASEDIIGFSNKDLEQEVRVSPLLKKGSKITIKMTDSGFTFVNFNFATHIYKMGKP